MVRAALRAPEGVTMGCGTWGVQQVLVGLHRVGLVGLGGAIQRAEQAGVTDRDTVVERIIDDLRADNYLPERLLPELRRAIWREVLRERGESFSEYLSQVEVTVRGEPGEDRDRFVDSVRAVFASFELEPVVAYEPSPKGLELVVGEHTIVRGHLPRRELEAAVRRSFSDW
jgi:hypothetical protein